MADTKAGSGARAKRRLNTSLPSELDFAKLTFLGRGLFAGRVNAGGRRVRLAADVAKAFPTERSVNEALRMLVQTAKSATRSRAGKRRAQATGASDE